MLTKLAVRNIKRSINDYILYVVTITLILALMFAFNSMMFFELILADEPTGALDSKSAQLLLETMEKMNQQLGATILMVTHDTFSASYAQRILFLKDGNLFKELSGQGKSRREFYNEILSVLVLLGGETNSAY